MDLPRTSLQREARGQRRQELMMQKERIEDKYLSYVAWLILEYGKYYRGKAGTPEGRSIIMSFESRHRAAKEDYQRQLQGVDSQLDVINRQIEDLARRGL